MQKATSERFFVWRASADAAQASERGAALPSAKRIAVLGAQVVLLFLLSKAGTAIVETLGLPFPGTVAGLLLLFAALALGLVRLSWVEEAATLLTRHLAFFFIPVAVGLMTFGDLLLANGAALLIALVASAAIGIAVTGGVAQLCSRKAAPGRRE